jgi:hypothetical protein
MEETMKENMMEENPYRTMGEQIAQLEAEGKLPEDFDLEAACNDDRFVELLHELEPYGAIRVYAAEQAAQNAKEAAREELRREAMDRKKLPQLTRGNRLLSPEEDYAAMSPEAFRALENRLRNHA